MKTLGLRSKLYLLVSLIHFVKIVLRDINVIFNYIQTHGERIKRREKPEFDAICLPGMTEDYRLNVYIHMDPKSTLRIIYASEDNTEEILQDM